MAVSKSRKKLEKDLWEDKVYYQQISKREHFNHPGFLLAKQESQIASIIADVGCGDGSKLAKLGHRKSKRYGFEISKEAVRTGKKKFPDLKLAAFNGKKLPLKNNTVDLICSFFVLEHTNNPEQLIGEMIRVLKPKGKLLLVAPNFGSPSRSSPPFKGSRLKKLVRGLLSDLTLKGHDLSWLAVEPKARTMKSFQPDDDTTIEPYIGSLVKFLGKRKMKVIKKSSCWDLELPSATIMQRTFGLLGRHGVWPFIYWGPHLLLLAEKP